MKPVVRQAIVTRYLGPTNFRGARIKATAYAKSKTVAYDHAQTTEGNHALAALELVKDLKWRGEWYQGGHPAGNGYVFVSAEYGTRDSKAFSFDPVLD